MNLKLVPSPRRQSTLRWTLTFFRAYRSRVALLASLSIAEIALRAASPWPFKATVDLLVASGKASQPVAWLLAIVGAGLALQIAHQLVLMFHTRVQARLAQDMVFRLRAQLFEHLQYLSLSQHAAASTADSVYRLDADAGCLEHLLLRGIFPSVFSALTLVVMFAILARLDEVLAVVSLAVVPFLFLNLRRHMTKMRPHAEHTKTLESALVARAYESLAAIRLVKTFAREDYEIDRFRGAATEATRARLDLTRHESLFSFVVGTITLVGSAAVLAVGGMHVLDGRITIGTLLLIVSYLGFVYGPLSAIATTTGALHGALASAARVRDVLAIPREPTNDSSLVENRRVRGEVRFEEVSFSYGPGRPVLDRVSFTARPGETVALVGLSGAGKSTLVSLIGRMYEPTGGRVLIDGVDASRYRLRALREQVAVVPQEATLLSGSVADNLWYGRLDATEHEVVLAARAAHAEEFIATLRRGFDMPIGEKGVQLSGGQKQRLSIARAFLKDAPILILDEPTAALDSISERAVLTALHRLRRGRTTFVIAHRLSTVRDAEKILVLDGGRVSAEGRHDELLESSPLYRQLCSQLADDGSASTSSAALG